MSFIQNQLICRWSFWLTITSISFKITSYSKNDIFEKNKWKCGASLKRGILSDLEFHQPERYRYSDVNGCLWNTEQAVRALENVNLKKVNGTLEFSIFDSCLICSTKVFFVSVIQSKSVRSVSKLRPETSPNVKCTCQG